MLAADLPPAMAQTEQLQIELVAADQQLVAGGRHWLGLRLRHAPHWHTYWRNPGDSGLPTRTHWTLPAGVSIGELQWPAPSRQVLGELHNFGYEGESFLPIELKLDPALGGDSLRLSVDVSWLVCAEECIPGKATLALERPLLAAADRSETAPAPDTHSNALQAALATVPATRDWPLTLTPSAAGFELELQNSTELGDAPELYPVQPQVLANSAPELKRKADSYRWSIARSDYFVVLPEPFEVVVKDPNSNLSYVLIARSVSAQP